MAHQRTIFDVLVLAFFLPAVVQVATSDVTCSSDKSQCAASNNPSDISGLIQMRVERSQDNDVIADNEELHGEDSDEDADFSDDDAGLSDDDADLSDDDVEAQASKPKIGIANTNSCPPGSVAISSADECRRAAGDLQKDFRKARSLPNHPKGCMTRKRRVWYNTHATGKKHRKFSPVCAVLSQAACGWTPYKFQQCVGNVAGGSLFWSLEEAQEKCSELGLSNCSAVTCRPGWITTCSMRKCATLSRSGHGEITYKPNAYPLDSVWTSHAYKKCDGNVVGAPIGDLAQAKAKCLELGPCKCRAVTCRKHSFTICSVMPTCAALTHSGHGEETYMPNR